MNGMPLIQASYDIQFVVLSVAVAILLSYVGLDFAERVAANRGPARLAWLSGGAGSMACGMWTMHLMAMIACRLPVPVFYHVPTLLLSILVAFAFCLVALGIATRSRCRSRCMVFASLIMGAGIATMHHVGMAAMRLPAAEQYSSDSWLLLLLQVAAVSAVVVVLVSYLRGRDHSVFHKFLVSLALGTAASAAHYTGMAGVHFAATGIAPDLAGSVDITAPASIAVLSGTVAILLLSLVISFAGRRHSEQHFNLDNKLSVLHTLIDNIPDLVFAKDLNSRFIVVNSQMSQVLGRGRAADELLGKTDSDFLPAEIADAIYADDQNVIRTGQALHNREETIRGDAGEEIHLLTSKVPLVDGEGRVFGIAGIARDISIRKRMENALRLAEQEYRGIFDNAVIGIFQSTPEGRFLNVNAAMATIFGYDSPGEMICSITDISQQWYRDPNRRREFLHLMHTVGGVHAFDLETIRKDGAKIWVSLSVRAKHRKGEILCYEGMCEDITERRQLREQLFQAQKLESVGQLAAGIAHEINTPMQYVGDNIRFVKDSFDTLKRLQGDYALALQAARDRSLSPEMLDELDAAAKNVDAGFLLEEIPRAIEQSLEGISRVSNLVSAMKEFSHPGTKEKIPLDLNHAIESTITVARNEWKYVATMETEFDRSLPMVPCQPCEFNQVILNLIVNAAHAIADTVRPGDANIGKIRVTTRNCPGSVEIRIQDTGTGIPEQVQPRIFDPFFTTKEIGKGTGQGLAIARSVVVDKHGGTIRFETEVGRGTTFIIRLPHDGECPGTRVVAA